MILIEQTIPKFENSKQIILDLLKYVTQQQAIWKPAVDKWSILEVVCHLVDEEPKDFRTRLDYTLNKPGESWPAIDPPSWVTEFKYNERELEQSKQEFVVERRKSIQWLSSKESPDFNKFYDHP